jgi:hypothetical protein
VLLLLLALAESHGAYDWHGDYVMIAVKSGNVPVLTELLSDGYELKWQQAQVGSRNISNVLLHQPCTSPTPLG